MLLDFRELLREVAVLRRQVREQHLKLDRLRQLDFLIVATRHLCDDSLAGSRWDDPMKSPIPKRSLVVGGRKTNVSVEDAFWNELKMIAAEREMTVSELVSSIDSSREHPNLSSAIRLFVLNYYMHTSRRRALTAPQRDASRARLKSSAR
jgi:predicted DNA-binding ribbon-helix-helix protein